MTEVKKFVDRRNAEEIAGGLATPILFWYDTEDKGRRRVNSLAVTTEGFLVVAQSVCSRKDQFVKAKGRLITSGRLLGRAQQHCWTVIPCVNNVGDMAAACAMAYRTIFPKNERGAKRAYNAGMIFVNRAQALRVGSI